jgi:DNA replication initiation complex subunit (GINS family)
VGDRVLFVKDADYEMEIEGEKLFRMKNENILCEVDEDFYMDVEEELIDEPGNIQDEIGSFEDYNRMMS